MCLYIPLIISIIVMIGIIVFMRYCNKKGIKFDGTDFC